MLTGVVQDPDSILKSMYWSFETDADLGKHMDQWKSSYQEAEFNKPFSLGASQFWLEPEPFFIGNRQGHASIPTLALVTILIQRWGRYCAIATIIRIMTVKHVRVSGMIRRSIAWIFI